MTNEEFIKLKKWGREITEKGKAFDRTLQWAKWQRDEMKNHEPLPEEAIWQLEEVIRKMCQFLAEEQKGGDK